MKFTTTLLAILAASSAYSHTLSKRDYNRCVSAIEKSGCPILKVSTDKESCNKYNSDKCQKILGKVTSLDGCATLSEESIKIFEKKFDNARSKLDKECKSSKKNKKTNKKTNEKKTVTGKKSTSTTSKKSKKTKKSKTSTTTTTAAAAATQAPAADNTAANTAANANTNANVANPAAPVNGTVPASSLAPAVTATVAPTPNTGVVNASSGASSLRMTTAFVASFGFLLYNLI
ncbi:hypothetical protein U3516DRAFT_885611 [Neocallimastix sp. 'constans']|jgi:septal ring factor EnvC (AmiA/AmiB activator)